MNRKRCWLYAGCVVGAFLTIEWLTSYLPTAWLLAPLVAGSVAAWLRTDSTSPILQAGRRATCSGFWLIRMVGYFWSRPEIITAWSLHSELALAVCVGVTLRRPTRRLPYLLLLMTLVNTVVRCWANTAPSLTVLLLSLTCGANLVIWISTLGSLDSMLVCSSYCLLSETILLWSYRSSLSIICDLAIVNQWLGLAGWISEIK